MANMAQAIRMALAYGEAHLGVTDVFGEDVGPPLGGVFTATQGLKTAWNSPLDERGIIGCAYGLALAGQRPVAEIQFCDYIFNTIDLIKLVGNAHWGCAGAWNLPLTVMTPVGAGIHGSIYHSHSFDAIMTHLPGWKIVMPSTPIDAYGLMIAALKDSNPVMYLKPKALLRTKGEELIPGEPADEKTLSKMIDAPLGDRSQWKPQWPDLTDYTVEIGKGKVVREGAHVTAVTYGRHVLITKAAAATLAEEGIEVEVIDLRSLFPYDWDLVVGSIRKTGRVVFINEDTSVVNFGEHLLRRAIDELFYELDARPRLVAGKHVPGVGLAPILEENSVPQQKDVERVLREAALEPA
ncbi:MAG TPA: transketolase C-terminal domain-containing protein [Planctomycetota bacterium]|nr:transketolase C-terminal domain-containing protein [Planctomycetota bacterium]